MSSAVELVSDHEMTELPIFEGVEDLIELLGALCRRPRFGDGPSRTEFSRRQRRTGRGLPMICLVRAQSQAGLLGRLARPMAEARPSPVPHCHARLPQDSIAPGRPSVARVGEVLARAAQWLGSSRNAKGGRIRFRRFGLLNWLMSQEKPAGLDSAQWSAELRSRLRKRDIRQRFDDAIASVGQDVPDPSGWLKALIGLARLVPPLLFRLRVTGRVPLVGRQYRWFLRQPHVTPEVPGGFLGFAERLTNDQDGWRREDPTQVARLLVNAFLEDLRRAWKSPWRIGGPRRMTYAVMLLDGITCSNGGYELLQLINDVRNEVGLFDPLFLICAGEGVPPRDEATRLYSAHNARNALAAWRRSLPEARRARSDTAWYLRIQIPDPADAVPDDTWQHVEALPGYRIARPPWWGRRVAPVTSIVVLLTGTLTGYVAWSERHCGNGWRWPAAGSTLSWLDGQCIGVTDGHYLFDPALAEVTRRILDQNRQAEQAYRRNPGRAYVTVVDLQALTLPPGATDELAAERESLQGVAVAQAQALGDRSLPLLRLLIGNAGTGMAYGTTVAAQLRDRSPTSAPLIGVVGLDHSTQAVDDTVLGLAIDGLPTVGSSLSEDQLGDSNPLYYQVSPQNRREAAVAAAFASTLRAAGKINSEVRVYYPDDPRDTYAQNLTNDALTSFAAAGFHPQKFRFAPSATPAAKIRSGVLYPFQNGKNTCGFEGLVYYAGDGVPDFNAFLDGVKKCPVPPALLADDDVTRYVADTRARQQNQSMPFWYTSFATAPTTRAQGVASDFYDGPAGLYALFPHDRGTNEDPSLDGHAALSYDATQVLIAAVQHLRLGNTLIPITPGTVWREISAIRSTAPTKRNPHPNNNSIQGVTGHIDFWTKDGSQHYPANKQISILLVQRGEVQSVPAFYCGAPSDPQQSAGCPVD